MNRRLYNNQIMGVSQFCQKEPWKILAVLGDRISGIMINLPPKSLLAYWQEHFGFSYSNRLMMDRLF